MIPSSGLLRRQTFHSRGLLRATWQHIVAVVTIFALVMVPALPVLAAVSPPAGKSPPPSTPEERMVPATRPAIAFIEVRWKGWVVDRADGRPLAVNGANPIQFTSTCTGFGINPNGYLVTAGHCVDPGTEYGAGADFLDIAAAWLQKRMNATGTAVALSDVREYLATRYYVEGYETNSEPERTVFVKRGVATSGLKGGEPIQARVVNFRKTSDGDMALLKIERTHTPSLLLTPTADTPVIGTPILAVGYAGSANDASDSTLEPSYKDGKISSIRTRNGAPYYEISAAVTEGMSGGPVLDPSGHVLGMTTGKPAGETQAFNFANAASTIRDILPADAVNELDPVDEDFQRGLDLYFRGDYKGAIESFNRTLGVMPMHQQAQEFKQRAMERLASSGGSNAGLMIGIAALTLLALVGAGAWFMLAMRRPSPTVTPVETPGPGVDGNGGTRASASEADEMPVSARSPAPTAFDDPGI